MEIGTRAARRSPEVVGLGRADGRTAIHQGHRAAGEQIIDPGFKQIFNLRDDFATNGSQFDHLFYDGESFDIGTMPAQVLHTPGHTPACATYVFGDAVFVGDKRRYCPSLKAA